MTYAVPGEKSSPRFAQAFAMGCKGPATNDPELRPGPVALFGSPARWDMLQQAIREGRDWWYGDHAIGRRFAYYRITRNAYQHPGVGPGSPERFQAMHLNLNPSWNTGGSAIVVCPNSPIYMSWFGIDAKQWTLDIVSQLQEVTDRPVIVRWKTQASIRPLYVDLHDAWMTVVFSSASAIDGLIAGVPCCTLAPWASSARMGITDVAQVETPYYPDMEERDRFLFTLAANQFTLDEMRNGTAWRWFEEGMDRVQ